MEDIRWKQRFESFENAFRLLNKAVNGIQSPSNLEKDGIIHRFEYTYEAAWRLMKEFVMYKEFRGIIGPKDAIELACQNILIADKDGWVAMINSRNGSHDHDVLENEYVKIKTTYYILIEQFYNQMKTA